MSTEAFKLYERVALECSRLGMRSDVLSDLEALYKLTEDNRVLREALEFYADKEFRGTEDSNYCMLDDEVSEVYEGNIQEVGTVAREALAKIKGEK